MAENIIAFLKENGLISFALIDHDGYSVIEGGSLGEEVFTFTEDLFAAFPRLRAEYIMWEQSSCRYLAFPLKEKYIFVSEINKETAFSKVRYFLRDIKIECETALQKM